MPPSVKPSPAGVIGIVVSSEAASATTNAPATEIGLPNAKKKDSTGICFIGERPFREFLNRYISKEPGPIKDENGRTIGKHQGLSFYTLGQRQGLGIGGVKEKGAQRGGGEHAPWFVARKDIEKNTLWVVQGHDHPWLQSLALDAGDTERGLDLLLGALPSADGARDDIRRVVIGILDELGVEDPLARESRRRLASSAELRQ